jgi:4'-phosphopantetheinyl transferase
VCTPEELARWRELPGGARRAAFFALWTRKEAVLKASGVGLSVPPTRVHVSLPAPAHGIVSLSGVAAAGPFQVVELTIGEGYAGALAHTGRAARVKCYALEPFTG